MRRQDTMEKNIVVGKIESRKGEMPNIRWIKSVKEAMAIRL